MSLLKTDYLSIIAHKIQDINYKLLASVSGPINQVQQCMTPKIILKYSHMILTEQSNLGLLKHLDHNSNWTFCFTDRATPKGNASTMKKKIILTKICIKLEN